MQKGQWWRSGTEENVPDVGVGHDGIKNVVNNNNRENKLENTQPKQTQSNQNPKCILKRCGRTHKVRALWTCKKWRDKSVEEKWELVRKYKVCPRCLMIPRPKTKTGTCCTLKCKYCCQNHNSLLCLIAPENPSPSYKPVRLKRINVQHNTRNDIGEEYDHEEELNKDIRDDIDDDMGDELEVTESCLFYNFHAIDIECD